MQEQSTRDAARESAFAYWRDKGRGITVVRKLIWQAIETARGAFNADELLAMVREQDKAVSPSTVYRNLKDLVDANVLQELQGPDDRKVYVVANGEMTATSHIVCRDCNKVIPVENPCLSLRESQLARQQGFSPKSMSLRLEADCDELESTGTCSNHDAEAKNGEK